MAEANSACFAQHWLASGGCSGKVCLWDLRKAAVEREISPYENGDAKIENGQARHGE